MAFIPRNITFTSVLSTKMTFTALFTAPFSTGVSLAGNGSINKPEFLSAYYGRKRSLIPENVTCKVYLMKLPEIRI